MDKLAKLTQLRNDWSDCRKCGLCTTRKNVVFGSGGAEADILIVGEAPGEEEDIAGLPFVGKAGKTMQRFLDIAQLDRKVDIFMTNVIGCRPTMSVDNEFTKESKIENRNPSKIEKDACRERLNQIIYTLDPLVIVAMGRIAFQTLTGKNSVLKDCRGDMHTMLFKGIHMDIRYPVLPVYHTTFLDSTYNYDENGPWGKTSGDFKHLCDVIDKLREMYRNIPAPDRTKGSEDLYEEDED